MDQYDVVIIGAGAAGLMCAATAAVRGRRVLLLDSSKKVGKKILMSGGGRCNFTNLTVEPDNYVSANPHFCKSALKCFTQWDFIALVEQYGIAYHEREHGQLFCDESARDILDMLLAECDKAGVSLVKGCVVESISYSSSYQINTAQGVYQTESLVIATGGLSIPTMGSSGFGYDVARQFGLKVLPQRAGLVPFAFSDRIKGVTERLSGIAIPVSMTSGERTFSEQMLFTHRGLSGPVVLQISNYWQPGESVTIDLLPGVDAIAWLLSLKKVHPKGSLKNLLAKRLPKKLVLELVTLYWAEWGERIIAELPDHQLNQIARLLNGWVLRPAGTEGYRTAEVTLGGVDTDELSSKTLECKRQPGLYFIGEVIDVTGHLGGFNFQWAWSSGYAAGQYS
ncbi:MAG: NAD(P)/FAD-dependent oxidoreductase [Sedimenticola sp.]|uniref:NAD(P)/FAD-dependent oxidoreductase n=1 Tax=Sedimenticola thiotaurini TaxID=1543721 RepID=A0A558D0D3_9GAMM|nr:NAD(P)/FAD-dependent oxidoreductase [Sedimenticola sp.]TVT54479.1 MAG: NAD(P)/FAD-dependent oxidoreductase [Sedimenticola thiotaurini]